MSPNAPRPPEPILLAAARIGTFDGQRPLTGASGSQAQDDALGLNCAWYADILLTLTGPGPART